MFRFKEFIAEGGNVTIATPKGEVSAERIDLEKIDRDSIAIKLKRALQVINAGFSRKYGVPLWGGDLFKSNAFLSGSSLHFFNTEIPSNVFVQYKRHLGDIDTQVDRAQEQNIKEFLNSIVGQKFGYITFVGFKTSAGQFITLWSFDKPQINVQIDLELVDFADGKPTQWSQFSHSSAWSDMKEGIKGVFQKYLMRALTTKTLREITVLKGKSQTPVKTLSTDLAFSVGQGLRQKLEPVLDETGKHVKIAGLLAYREIPTKSSTYINDLNIMFEILFGVVPTGVDLELFGSFVGGLQLVKKHFSTTEQRKVIEGFAHTLWGPGAQGLYRGNPEQDQSEKMTAFLKMTSVLGSDYDTIAIDKMRVAYYEKYKA